MTAAHSCTHCSYAHIVAVVGPATGDAEYTYCCPMTLRESRFRLSTVTVRTHPALPRDVLPALPVKPGRDGRPGEPATNPCA